MSEEDGRGSAVQGRIGFEVKALQQVLRAAMDTALRDCAVSTSQYAVLAALRDLPAASGAELAARTFMSPQSLNELLVRLERRGLVARRPHPTHGRILEASLTPDGAARLEEADQIVRAIEGQMVHALSPVERQALARMLEACRVALSTKPTA